MRTTRKKKTPITATPIHRDHPSTSTSSSSNPRTTRTLIRHFHVLLKKQRQLQKLQDVNASGASDARESKEDHARGLKQAHARESKEVNARELRDVEEEIERMGGLAAYQRMSRIGQGKDRGGGSEKVLIGWLVGMGLGKKDREEKGKLRLLEVGALKPDDYASCSSWIDTTPIDLRSQHPSIMEQDFLRMDLSTHAGKWDIISLSLVVNFVPEPKDRGRMLILAHQFLRASGFLFLVLPLPCVENSRYMTFEHLESLMSTIGFVEIEKKWRQGGKMAYWLYKKIPWESPPKTEGFRKKSSCRQGKRNNFCILLE